MDGCRQATLKGQWVNECGKCENRILSYFHINTYTVERSSKGLVLQMKKNRYDILISISIFDVIRM